MNTKVRPVEIPQLNITKRQKKVGQYLVCEIQYNPLLLNSMDNRYKIRIGTTLRNIFIFRETL